MTEKVDLAAKLHAEGERLFAFFEGIESAQWVQPVYTEGEVWTVRDALAHLMTTNRAFNALFEQIRTGGEGVTEDFVIDRYNASQRRKTLTLSPAELLLSFRRARAEMVAWLSGLDEADLQKSGRHPFLGRTTLREMVKMVYIHDQVHYRDIRRALKAQV